MSSRHDIPPRTNGQADSTPYAGGVVRPASPETALELIRRGKPPGNPERKVTLDLEGNPKLTGRAKANRRRARNARRLELQTSVEVIQSWLRLNAANVTLSFVVREKLSQLELISAELASIPPQGPLQTPKATPISERDRFSLTPAGEAVLNDKGVHHG